MPVRLCLRYYLSPDICDRPSNTPIQLAKSLASGKYTALLLFLESVALGNLKRYQEALEGLDKALAIDPQNAVVACPQ